MPTSAGIDQVVLRAFDVITSALWPAAKPSDVWAFNLTKGKACDTAHATDARALDMAIVKAGETAEALDSEMVAMEVVSETKQDMSAGAVQGRALPINCSYADRSICSYADRSICWVRDCTGI